MKRLSASNRVVNDNERGEERKERNKHNLALTMNIKCLIKCANTVNSIHPQRRENKYVRSKMEYKEVGTKEIKQTVESVYNAK